MKKIILFFLISIVLVNCKNIIKDEVSTTIDQFFNQNKDLNIEIFKNWNVWKRSNGIVFDYIDNEHRLLIINNNKEEVLFKEIFPKQDSVFYPLIDIESRFGQYPFGVTDFAKKVFLFKKLKVDRINSIIENSLIMFINENYTIIYSEKGTNIRELNRYKEYSKHNNYWYYYLKE